MSLLYLFTYICPLPSLLTLAAFSYTFLNLVDIFIAVEDGTSSRTSETQQPPMLLSVLSGKFVLFHLLFQLLLSKVQHPYTFFLYDTRASSDPLAAKKDISSFSLLLTSKHRIWSHSLNQCPVMQLHPFVKPKWFTQLPHPFLSYNPTK